MIDHQWQRLGQFSKILGFEWKCSACCAQILSWVCPKPGPDREMQFMDRRGRWKRAPVPIDCSFVQLRQIRRVMDE